MSRPEDTYLGDGVYASFDGWLMWLDLRAQDSTTRIGIEPEVFEALVRYAKLCWNRKPENKG